MRNITDLEKIKEKAKILFDVVELTPEPSIPILCVHPYTSTVVTYSNERKFDLLKQEDYEDWRSIIFKIIDSQTDINGIIMLLGNAWYLTFLKLIKDNLSINDFSHLLSELWVQQENPNGDVNVSLKLAVKWFREANKELLMSEKDLEKYNSFEAGSVFYRGVAVGRKANGLSWTTSYEKAKWFAHRFDSIKENENGYVQKLKIKDKNNILAYISIRNEEEVVVDTFKEKDYEIIE